MKYKLIIFFFLHSLKWGMAQMPNVCVAPPPPYQQGGSFAIILQKNGTAFYGNEICVSGNGISQTIGVINADPVTLTNAKYLYDVKDNTAIPLPSSISLVTIQSIDNRNVGEYWIMQIGEDPTTGQPKLSCQLLKIQEEVEEPPLKYFTADYEPTGEVTVRVLDEVPQKPLYTLYTSNRAEVKARNESPVLIDNTPSANGEDCYTVTFEGGCQTESQFSAPICALYLESGITNLFWNNLDYNVPTEVSYSLWKVTETGLVERVADNITNGAFTVENVAANSETLFFVQAQIEFSDLGATPPQTVRSNRAKLKPRVYPFLPTVFTPNNDGVNDFLEVSNPFQFSEFAILVYDRIGQMVWQNTSTNGFLWDGNNLKNNEPVPNGIYTYQLKFRFGDSDFEVLTGKIEILR